MGPFGVELVYFACQQDVNLEDEGKNAIYCLCTFKIHVEILTPNLIVRRWGFGRLQGLEDGTGIVSLYGRPLIYKPLIWKTLPPYALKTK